MLRWGGVENGWWLKFSNGLILQAGTISEGMAANMTCTLFQPFTTTNYFAIATPYREGSAISALIGVYDKTETTFSLRCIDASGTGIKYLRQWMAIGF